MVLVLDLWVTLAAIITPACSIAWLLNGKLSGMAKEIESLHRENRIFAGWRDGVDRRLESMESHLRGGEK